MGEILVTDDTEYLGKFHKCFLTGEQGVLVDPRSGISLQREHIIPVLAIKQNKRVLAGFKDLYDNLGWLCDNCHTGIDDAPTGKMEMYRKHGLAGLVEYIAVDYPDSGIDELRAVQFFQFKSLFQRIQRALQSLKENYPPHRESDYSTSLDLIGIHLERWDSRQTRKSHELSKKRSRVPRIVQACNSA